MNILTVIDYDQKAGGGFSYALSMCELLSRSFPAEYQFFFASTSLENNDVLRGKGFSTVIGDLIYRKPDLVSWIKRKLTKYYGLQASKSIIDQTVEKHSIDLVYFLTPTALARTLTNAPFFFTVWDFCHRDWPEFPEVNTSGIFEGREELYRNTLPRAIAVIVDSECLAEKTVRYYGINRDRITIVPFLFSDSEIASIKDVDVITKYSLRKPFIYYPAQFWAHKNHYYILEALASLRNEKSVRIDAVFSGTDYGTLEYINKSAEKMNIAEQIHYLGFIPREDVWNLYKNAIALAMPTYFGPTNIPPLEALAVGCPVLYSDLPEFRAEYDGAASFMDLDDPQSMVELLIAVLNKDPILERHKKAGEKILENHDIKNIQKILEKTFFSYNKILKRWHIE